MGGTGFILPDASEVEKMMSAVQTVLTVWGPQNPSDKKVAPITKKVSKAR
jgi:hypothetical protein